MTDARALTAALGGRWHARYGTAPCPVCQPERRRDQNALTLTDGRGGRLLAHCKRAGCSFWEIAAAAGLRSGDYYAPPEAARRAVAKREAARRAEAERRADQARRLWHEAQPIGGTPADAYLHGRGILLLAPPTALRWHPAAWHPTGRHLPAMVGLVRGADLPAVHRTYIRPDGSKKADVDPAKAMLGGTAGGAVRLTDGTGALLVAEGIESTLAAWLLQGDATAGAWAALSTSGLRGLRLPSEPGRLCIAPDGDAPGMAAAHALAERADALGWQVSIAAPPAGRDWADVLMARKGLAA